MVDPGGTSLDGPSTWVQRAIVHPCVVVFVTLELESSSRVARILSVLFILVTLLSIFATVVASEPSLMYTPTTCFQPACNNNPRWCPGYMICPPEPSPVFETIENLCIYLFTIEYGMKFLTCWSVSPQTAGILPQEDTVRSLNDPDDPVREYGPIEQTLRWAKKFKNVVDLVCWLPFYVAMVANDGHGSSTVARMFRLLRLIRVFRLLNVLHVFEQVSSPSIGRFHSFVVSFLALTHITPPVIFVPNNRHPDVRHDPAARGNPPSGLGRARRLCILLSPHHHPLRKCHVFPRSRYLHHICRLSGRGILTPRGQPKVDRS
jgi:hypothetical protein